MKIRLSACSPSLSVSLSLSLSISHSLSLSLSLFLYLSLSLPLSLTLSYFYSLSVYHYTSFALLTCSHFAVLHLVSVVTESTRHCCRLTCNPRNRAASSTIPPRAQLTMRTPSLHFAIESSPISDDDEDDESVKCRGQRSTEY